MSALNAQILRFESLPSTNLEAAQRAVQGAPEGLCVVADEQTAGRGRHQRKWVSPKGAGLYLSIILRPTFSQSGWPLLTLLTAVAVHDTLREVCSLETDIKWPNDILVNEKKLCGILAETVETPTGRAVVVGIGINLTSESFPAELAQVATSVADVTGNAPVLETLVDTLTRQLLADYQQLHRTEGPAEIVDEWCSRSSYASGKTIRVSENGQTFAGITRGLESDGALRVETGDGEVRIVRAGDVTAVRPVLV